MVEKIEEYNFQLHIMKVKSTMKLEVRKSWLCPSASLSLSFEDNACETAPPPSPQRAVPGRGCAGAPDQGRLGPGLHLPHRHRVRHDPLLHPHCAAVPGASGLPSSLQIFVKESVISFCIRGRRTALRVLLLSVLRDAVQGGEPPGAAPHLRLLRVEGGRGPARVSHWLAVWLLGDRK